MCQATACMLPFKGPSSLNASPAGPGPLASRWICSKHVVHILDILGCTIGRHPYTSLLSPLHADALLNDFAPYTLFLFQYITDS